MLERDNTTEHISASRRPGRIARAAAALAMALTACTHGDAGPAAQDRAEAGNQLEYSPDIWEYSEYYGANLVSLRWEKPENIDVAGHRLKIYRERGQASAMDTQDNIVDYARNSLLLTSAEVSALAADGTAGATSQAVTAPKELGHVFFIFGSRESMAQADPQGFFGPITGTKADLRGQSVENLTMAGPLLPEASLIFHTMLNDRINKLQQAVCVNMLEVELSSVEPGAADTPQVPESRGEAYARAQAALDMKAELCGNLGLAATIKAGAQHVEDLGGAYSYYAMITDALRDEAIYYNQERPYVKLPPELFDRILV